MSKANSSMVRVTLAAECRVPQKSGCYVPPRALDGFCPSCPPALDFSIRPPALPLIRLVAGGWHNSPLSNRPLAYPPCNVQ